MDEFLTWQEEVILAVLMDKKHSMTPPQIVNELKKDDIEMSRPTVAKYLRSLKKKGYLKEI